MGASLVTVVMPVYNAAPYLRAAVESVLGQTLADFSLLVVDDGSTDESPTILRAFSDPRLRVVTRPHRGIVSAMRTALALVDTDLVARADADDVCRPRRLERQVGFLTAHPEVALVGAAVRRLGRRLAGPPDAPRIRWMALYQNPLANPTIVFRRSAALEAGGDTDDHVYLDDYPFVSRMIERYDAANLPEVLVTMTVHADSISKAFSAEAVAEADRVRRANLRRLVARDDVVEPLRYLLSGGPAPAGFDAEHVGLLLGHLLGRFRERYGTGAKSGAVGRWIGRQIFERALLHGPTAPRVLAAMMRAALRLNPALAADPRVAKALFLHLVVYRRRARR